MTGLPAEKVTFLFADVEDSTPAHQRLGPRYPQVLRQYVRWLRKALEEAGGREAEAEGTAILVAFRRARDAVAAAAAVQRAGASRPWPQGVALRVRIGVHSGDASATRAILTGLRALLVVRISAAGHGGQILVSKSTQRLLKDDPPPGVNLRDLGLHRLKDLQRVERLFQVVQAGLPVDFPPLRSLDALPNNLPTQLTSFIGREREIAEGQRLLSITRLLTLTGAGGCGKTRLAVHLAAEVLDDYQDGVWFIELAPLSDPALISQAIASVLRVPEPRGRPLDETLHDHLRPKALLLVLDNCEHLLPGCAPVIDALLRDCPNLRVLATSTAVLGVAGETAQRVPSLSLPPLHRRPPAAHLMQSEAVRLFVERALARVPTFTVTDQNAAAVLHICTQLDGIPLAIELAAARMNVLAVEEIAARLEDRFRLLTGGTRTILPRHSTLRATMDWSYDLLSENERILWRRLSVFVGGWTLEALDAVCSGKTDVHAADILDLLGQLVDKSIVMVDLRPGKTRYRLLETVRQFGREKLVEAGEASDVRRRHRDWYLDLAEQADPKLRGPELGTWLERLEMEHDNLRAALVWSATELGQTEAELRLAAALRWFWFIHGHWTEGRRWLEHALSRSDGMPPTLMPKLLHGAATLARFQGDHDRALALSERGLALSRELGDHERTAWFLIWLGAIALHQSDYDRAAALFAESLPLSRALDDKWLISMALADLGVVARLQGDYERAAVLHTESLALGREVGDKWRSASSLASLGLVALLRGEHERAAMLYEESLTLCREIRDRWIVYDCLDGLAAVTCAQGQYEQAARLLGAAEALRTILGFSPLAVDQVAHAAHVAAARAGLEDAAFAAAWADGQSMTLEQTIDQGLASTHALSIHPKRTRARPSDAPVDLLAPREREIAALVARGHTNRKIAALLGIAERTAETHVQHILNKLGFTSRVQIATWATEQGLHIASPD